MGERLPLTPERYPLSQPSPFQMSSYQSPGEKGDSEPKQRELFSLSKKNIWLSLLHFFHFTFHTLTVTGENSARLNCHENLCSLGWVDLALLSPMQNCKTWVLCLIYLTVVCTWLSCHPSQVCFPWISLCLHGPLDRSNFFNQNTEVQFLISNLSGQAPVTLTSAFPCGPLCQIPFPTSPKQGFRCSGESGHCQELTLGIGPDVSGNHTTEMLRFYRLEVAKPGTPTHRLHYSQRGHLSPTCFFPIPILDYVSQ